MGRCGTSLLAACLLAWAACACAAATDAAAAASAASDAAVRNIATRRLQAALQRTAGDGSIAEQIVSGLPHSVASQVADTLPEALAARPQRRLMKVKEGGPEHGPKGSGKGMPMPGKGMPMPGKGMPMPTKGGPVKPVDPCDATFGTAKKVTAVLVADTGSFTGVAEGSFYAANLKNAKTVNANDTLCATRQYGTLVGQPVILVATGIGPTAAAICLSELLQCASRIKEVLYSGTAGWTPQVGGIINSDECGAAQHNGALKTLARIGDVCVSPFSMNWNCKLADYSQQTVGAPNLCSLPQETDHPDESFLYGDCVFTTPDKGSMALTKRVYAAATSANGVSSRPKRDKKVKSYESAYFKLMGKGTGVAYKYSSTAPATVWDYKTCMEVDSQFFYSGPPYDEIARVYIQDYLSAGLNMTISKKDVLVVSAMEAVGVMELLTKFNSKPQNPKIPYVMVRGNSDYLYAPIQKLANGTWGYEPNPPVADFTVGYAYAIATTSNVVMQYLKTGCTAAHGANSRACTYTIDYPSAISGARRRYS